MDNRLILSGSEDTNVRIWKANAADAMKTLLPREKVALAYANKLKDRHKYDPTVRRILRHEHLPAGLKKRKEIIHVKKVSQHRKQVNMRANNRVEDAPLVPARTKDLDKLQLEYN